MELCDRDIEIVAIRWPIGPYFARLHDVYNDFEDNKSWPGTTQLTDLPKADATSIQTIGSASVGPCNLT